VREAIGQRRAVDELEHERADAISFLEVVVIGPHRESQVERKGQYINVVRIARTHPTVSVGQVILVLGPLDNGDGKRRQREQQRVQAKYANRSACGSTCRRVLDKSGVQSRDPSGQIDVRRKNCRRRSSVGV